MQEQKFHWQEKPENINAELQSWIASVIGKYSPLGRELFQRGVAIKGTNPIFSDALRVAGIMLAMQSIK